LNDLGVDASRQELACMAVAEIVEADPREVLGLRYEPREKVGKVSRLHRSTIFATANESIARLPNTNSQRGLGLRVFQLAQFINGEGGGLCHKAERSVQLQVLPCLGQWRDNGWYI
jgi:hypothetical protein